MEELDFSLDDYADICAKDSRYNPRAYTLLMDCVNYLTRTREHASGEAILDEFRNRTLDLFGPLSFFTLTEWGVTCCEDIGEMMFNLAEFHRVEKGSDDTPESFIGGYDFRETFYLPYAS